VKDSYSKRKDGAEFRKEVAEKVGLGFELPPEKAVVFPPPPSITLLDRMDRNSKLDQRDKGSGTVGINR
jgi:hypothetical protein